MGKSTSYDKKLAQIRRIQQQADEKIGKLKAEADYLRSQEIKPVIISILDAMAQYGITVDDITEAVQVANSFRRRDKTIKVRGRTAGSNLRRKPLPKYRNDKGGETWSGRGKVPKWLREAEEHGKSRESFLVKKSRSQ